MPSQPPTRLHTLTLHLLTTRLTILLTIVISLWLLGKASPLHAATHPTTHPTNATAPLCRFGLNVSSFPNTPYYIDDFNITPLRVGWYIDYRAVPSSAANNGAAYAQVVSVYDNEHGDYGHSPSGAALTATIAAHPGGIYIIGNEPDRRELQGDMLPENYAHAYHAAYTEIKAKDPTAQVWAGAIVQPTPLRLLYLDRVLAEYTRTYGRPLPTDGWAIHGFLLNERSCQAHNNNLNVCWGAEIPPGIDATDGQILTPQDNARLDLFTSGIVRFRTWMAANGYRNTALHLSEYGVLMPEIFGFPPAVVNDYMNATYDYLLTATDPTLGYPADDNRLVQRFAWFSTFDPTFNGAIYQRAAPHDLTSIGANFRDYTAAQTASSDLAVLSLHQETDAAGAAQLVATIANSGNRLHPTTATLRFSAGSPSGPLTPIGSDQPITLAGCGATTTITLPWPLPTSQPTTHQIQAELLAPNFNDANPTNNHARTIVITNPSRLHLPLIPARQRQ